MEFAAEPIMDAFTPPPRTAARPNAPADTGPTFDEHLDAVNEPAPETTPPSPPEAKGEASTVDTKPEPRAETQPEQVDPDVALLGGPAPAPPPQIAAPVLVQIAATQAGPTQTAPAETPTTPQPVNAAPQAAAAPTQAPSTPEATTPVQAAAPVAPKAATTNSSEAQSARASPSAPQISNPTSAPSTQPEAAVQQAAAPIPNAEPIAAQQLPEAVRQAIAAAIAPAPQATGAVQRAARPAPQAVEPKTPDANAAKSAAAAPNAAAKVQTAKAVTAPAAAGEPAPAAQVASSAADTTQVASTSTAAAQASTHVQHAAADTGTQRAAPAAAQVAREIVRRFDGGNTSFELRLDPAELGRVEIRMDVSRDHKVTAVITADNPQALTELARQARELEAQLQSAGLQLSDNGLSFDLRQGANEQAAQDANGAQRGAGGEDAPLEQAQAPTARPIGFERWRGVRVDMMV